MTAQPEGQGIPRVLFAAHSGMLAFKLEFP
jgi:hypothetical protein